MGAPDTNGEKWHLGLGCQQSRSQFRGGNAAIRGTGALEKDSYRPTLVQGLEGSADGAAIGGTSLNRIGPIQFNSLPQNRDPKQLLLGHVGH